VEYNTFINFNEGKSSEFPLQSVLLSCFWLHMNIVYFSIVSAVISASQKITQHSVYFLSFPLKYGMVQLYQTLPCGTSHDFHLYVQTSNCSHS